MKPCPEGIKAHEFKCCDTHGGSAHSNWYLLMKHKGVFIGFNNHKWVVFASSDPSAEWSRGCQDSCAYGDPRPQSKSAKLITIQDVPESARPLAVKWVEEAILIAREKISANKNKIAKEEEAKKKAKEAEYNEKIRTPWEKAFEKENSNEKE